MIYNGNLRIRLQCSVFSLINEGEHKRNKAVIVASRSVWNKEVNKWQRQGSWI